MFVVHIFLCALAVSFLNGQLFVYCSTDRGCGDSAAVDFYCACADECAHKNQESFSPVRVGSLSTVFEVCLQLATAYS